MTYLPVTVLDDWKNIYTIGAMYGRLEVADLIQLSEFPQKLVSSLSPLVVKHRINLDHGATGTVVLRGISSRSSLPACPARCR